MTAPTPQTHFQKTNAPQSILYRSSNFHYNVSGYVSGSKPWLNQVHHIMVCCLFKQAKLAEALSNDMAKTDYVCDCLWVTPWDINRAQNLFQLPLWGAYVKSYRKATGIAPPAGGPNNLPAHDRDHNGKGSYTEEVKTWLRANIWDSLTVQKSPHAVDLQLVFDQLETGEKDWLTELKNRATTRGAGTWMSWLTRPKSKKNPTGVPNPLWYEAFSMSSTPKPRTSP
jgi:hypothetical protein